MMRVSKQPVKLKSKEEKDQGTNVTSSLAVVYVTVTICQAKGGQP